MVSFDTIVRHGLCGDILCGPATLTAERLQDPE
jgi:hypothetical protein